MPSGLVCTQPSARRLDKGLCQRRDSSSPEDLQWTVHAVSGRRRILSRCRDANSPNSYHFAGNSVRCSSSRHAR